MNDCVIVDAIRSPIGKHRGSLARVRPDDLLAQVIHKLVLRTSLNPKDIDEVIAGCANQAGEDNRNVARMASLLAGLPYEVPALTVNRLCASGLEAVIQATRAIQTGDCNVVIASGVESMTRAPLVVHKGDDAYASGNRTLYDTSLGWRFPNPKLEARFPLESMGETAENIAAHYRITRAQQDAFALESHRRAVRAWEENLFSSEVVPVLDFARDEGPRPDTTLEKLASLKAAFRTGGTVTAGNASSLNDGAAAIFLASSTRAKELGLTPLARVVTSAACGVDPRMMGLGPIPACHRALAKAQLKITDIDFAEVNEAFAVQVLAVCQELALPLERVNVNGGAIALGHPLGCSGARVLTTLVHQLRRTQSRYGLATLCVGVGQGVCMIVESLC